MPSWIYKIKIWLKNHKLVEKISVLYYKYGENKAGNKSEDGIIYKYFKITFYGLYYKLSNKLLTSSFSSTEFY